MYELDRLGGVVERVPVLQDHRFEMTAKALLILLSQEC
jgi:hypothetical protein